MCVVKHTDRQSVEPVESDKVRGSADEISNNDVSGKYI